MLAAVICSKMKWDYWTYMAQPDWFIKLLIIKYSCDAEYEEYINKKHQRQSKYK